MRRQAAKHRIAGVSSSWVPLGLGCPAAGASTRLGGRGWFDESAVSLAGLLAPLAHIQPVGAAFERLHLAAGAALPAGTAGRARIARRRAAGTTVRGYAAAA